MKMSTKCTLHEPQLVTASQPSTHQHTFNDQIVNTKFKKQTLITVRLSQKSIPYAIFLVHSDFHIIILRGENTTDEPLGSFFILIGYHHFLFQCFVGMKGHGIYPIKLTFSFLISLNSP